MFISAKEEKHRIKLVLFKMYVNDLHSELSHLIYMELTFSAL
jgi:hypothetical protein